MSVPNIFATATTAIPLTNLDANFQYYDNAYQITSTSISFTGAVTLAAGIANGVPYLNGSKVLTTGSALTFDGTNLETTGNTTLANNKSFRVKNVGGTAQAIATLGNDNNVYMGQVSSPTAGALFLYGSQQIYYAGASEGMRLTSTGLGIGTSSPRDKLDVRGTPFSVGGVASGNLADFVNTSTAYNASPTSAISLWTKYNAAGDVYPSAVISAGKENSTDGNYAGYLSFITAPAGGVFTERMRLDSTGNLLVGTTSVGNSSKQTVDCTGTNGIAVVDTGNTSGRTYMTFISNGSTSGSISRVGTTAAVAYNTSSDYRLKNITGPITNSGAYIDSLNPVEGTWKADGSTFVGLIAHEVQKASRTNVATGVKDGEEMQAMDYSNSELIANLIAEVKSLRARLAAANI